MLECQPPPQATSLCIDMLKWFYFSYFTDEHQHEDQPMASSTPIDLSVVNRKDKGNQGILIMYLSYMSNK